MAHMKPSMRNFGVSGVGRTFSVWVPGFPELRLDSCRFLQRVQSRDRNQKASPYNMLVIIIIIVLVILVVPDLVYALVLFIVLVSALLVILLVCVLVSAAILVLVLFVVLVCVLVHVCVLLPVLVLGSCCCSCSRRQQRWWPSQALLSLYTGPWNPGADTVGCGVLKLLTEADAAPSRLCAKTTGLPWTGPQ